MINFNLTPSSGYADSYWDIKFTVEFDMADLSIVKIFNKTINEDIDILGVSSGYIKNEKTAIDKNVNQIEGYINIFNKDKMNKKFINFLSVDIECVVEMHRGSNVSEEKQTLVFYNEGKSLDASVIPFDLVIDNTNIDIKNNIPLRMHVICESEKLIELCIRSETGDVECPFDVFAKKGRTDVVLPSEVIFHDLDFNKNSLRKFNIYYIKHEGIDLSGFVNRKYISIHNSRIELNSRLLTPEPQTRIGPTSINLSNDFVLSDRYFVHTYKEYTSYSGRLMHSKEKMTNLTRFMHESQHMMAISEKKKKVKKLDVDKEKQIRKEIRRQSFRDEFSKKEAFKFSENPLLTKLHKSYSKKINKSTIDVTKKSVRKSGGCGCSRKRGNA